MSRPGLVTKLWIAVGFMAGVILGCTGADLVHLFVRDLYKQEVKPVEASCKAIPTH
jgi:demethoxyubiquinone hydroxylase (CLK1/Coq7/Cat5 family)